MVEKKKILKQLVFFVCILIASSSIVNAQTITKCPEGLTTCPGDSSKCYRKASSMKTKPDCKYDKKQVTYTTVIYVNDAGGKSYDTKICKQAQCSWNKVYNWCPDGTYFAGWQKVSGKVSVYGSYIYTTSDISSNYSGYVKALCYNNKPPVTDNGTGKTIESQPIEEPVENVCPKSENKEKIINANNYKFTYNLDGGHFIDGSTERTEIIDSYSVVGAFRLNPLKKDYVLDPSNAKCYKYLKFNREGNTTSKASIDNVMQVPYQTNQSPTAGKAYNYTTISYEDGSRMCYGYNAPSEDDPGEIIYIKDSKLNTIGKNNATYYFSENGKNVEYEGQDWWKSADTCDFGSYCNLDTCTKVSGACDVTWSAIIFHSVDATYAKELDTTEIVEGKNTISKGNTGDKSKEEISENPKTRSKLWIFITLGVAFSAAGTYYYRKYRKTEV